MGWQDRSYNPNRIGDGGFNNPILNLLFGSFPLGTYFGIRVRIHSSLILYAIFEILFARSERGLGVVGTIMQLVVLFTIILIHEFGHCFGGRSVGGSAEDILLWPLGGLAYANAPHRPWPTFVTVAAGPLANVIICAITGIALFLIGHFDARWLNPLVAFGGNLFIDKDLAKVLTDPTSVMAWLFWFFTVSASLFFFNLLPIFPLDGGQMLQSILWKPLGYRRSMNFACITGMIGAGFGFVFGLWSQTGMLVFLAIAGFMTCYQKRMILKMTPDEEEDQYDLSAAWDSPDTHKAKRKKLRKSSLSSARKRALRDQADQAKIDAILVKVKEKGLHSLTWWEKRTLKKATARQREADTAANRF